MEQTMPAGYSGKPTWQKLGLQPTARIATVNAPADYATLVEIPASELALLPLSEGDMDLVHLFVTERAMLAEQLPILMQQIKQNGMIWVSWPKKASKVATDVTEDAVRAVALPLDLVDVKVAAIDATWSGLKLVIRKEKRR